jgi:hypothetical protein
MVKEALGKVDSGRVTSSGFGLISCVSEEQKERTLFFGAGYRLKDVISGVSLEE